jgi:hypothetical protein
MTKHCDLCGTKVKVVGDETMHYEPVVDREMLLGIIKSMHAGCCECVNSASEEELADAIISAMYGDKE